MMKRVMMVGMALLIGASCSAPEMYRITGTLPGAEEGTLVKLTGVNSEGEDSLLFSGRVTNGNFAISVTEKYDMAYLRMPKGQQRIPVFFEPQIKTYRLEVDADGRGEMKGGAMQELWNEYHARNAVFEGRKRVVERAYKRFARKAELFGKMHQRAIYEELVEEQEQFEDSLLRCNDNIVAASIVWLRRNELLDNHRFGGKVALLGPQALQTAPGKAVKRIAEQMLRTENGNIAPDFTQNDPHGNPVSLYGIQAKVIVLDFWASWCGPCRAETPNVRRIYEKYKDKGLEIISVSLDTKKENWMQAIQNDGMNWIHTSDLQGWDNTAAELYGVRSIPAIFVLDENHRIIGQNLRGKELEDTIEKLIKK